MSGYPKRGTAVPVQSSQEIAEQQQRDKHVAQIRAAAANTERALKRAEATSALLANERAVIQEAISRLQSAATSTQLAVLSRNANEAAELLRTANEVASTAEWRRRVLDELRRLAGFDLSNIRDAELRARADEHLRLALASEAKVRSGVQPPREGAQERSKYAVALERIRVAQDALDELQRYVGELDAVNIDARALHGDAVARIRARPETAHQVRREMAKAVEAKARSERNKGVDSRDVERWTSLRTQFEAGANAARPAISAGNTTAPDMARTAQEALDAWARGLQQLDSQWVPEEAERLHARFEETLEALRRAMAEADALREAAVVRAAASMAGLRAELDAIGDVANTSAAEAIARDIANLALAHDFDDVGRQEAFLRKRIADLAQPVAAASVEIDRNAINTALLNALRAISGHNVEWDERAVRRLAEAPAGVEVLVTGRVLKTNAAINWRFTYDAKGELSFETSDGEGPSCDYMKLLPHALYAEGVFERVSASDGEDWNETVDATSGVRRIGGEVGKTMTRGQ